MPQVSYLPGLDRRGKAEILERIIALGAGRSWHKARDSREPTNIFFHLVTSSISISTINLQSL